jgi:hypothetical protein
MPEKAGSESGETPESLPQHPLVGRLKPDPAQPAQRVIELVGLPGDSDRAGYQRLYLTARLDYYAEFQVQDIVYTEAVAADVSPVAGQEATKVSIRRDATINYTWVRSPQPVDEFDLDVRLGAAGSAIGPAGFPTNTCPDGPCGISEPPCLTQAATCFGQATCPNTRCNTCAGLTCPATHCNTCLNTCAGHATCPPTHCNTCAGVTCPPTRCNTCAGATCPGTQCNTCPHILCHGTHGHTCTACGQCV